MYKGIDGVGSTSGLADIEESVLRKGGSGRRLRDDLVARGENGGAGASDIIRDRSGGGRRKGRKEAQADEGHVGRRAHRERRLERWGIEETERVN